jgi:hypothetical protein
MLPTPEESQVRGKYLLFNAENTIWSMASGDSVEIDPKLAHSDPTLAAIERLTIALWAECQPAQVSSYYRSNLLNWSNLPHRTNFVSIEFFS